MNALVVKRKPQRQIALAGAVLMGLMAVADGRGEERGVAPRSGIDKANFAADTPLHEDFYQHVNGGWLDKTEIPPDKSNYGSFSVLADEAEAALREIVEQLASASDKPVGSDEQKLDDFYQSFMDLQRLNAIGMQPLSDSLAQIAAIDSTDRLIQLMARAEREGWGNPLGMYVAPDAKKSDEYTVYLTQSGTTLPDRDYYLLDEPRFQAIRAAYKKYITALLSAGNYPQSQRAAERILDLETRMAQVQWTRVENRDPVKSYNRMTRQETAAQLPHFDWQAFVQAVDLGRQENFVVRQPSYVQGLDAIYQETPLDEWKDYYSFHLIDSFAPALGDTFDSLHFDFHQRTLSGVAEPSERWKRGIQMLDENVGEMLGKLYVRQHFSPQAKQRMQSLVENLKRAFAQRVQQLDWMSRGTKIQALEKLSKFTTKIGYPDQWRDYGKLEIKPGDLVGNLIRARAFEHDRQLAKLGQPIDRGEWGMTPQTVNAYYNPLMNEIVFPAAILQPPFFDMQADDAVNYGAIGAVIGHELSHGFDDKGSKFDGDGNLRNWWTNEDRAEFEKRAKRLVQQYAQYAPIDNIHLNGELTLGENIGDLGGLNVAHTAYRLSLGETDPPVIEELTGDQRFFLGWGQIWRRKYRDEELRRRLLVDPHSPSRYRANGVVVNMDAFHEAFGVQPGQAMYLPAEQRVRIW